ncbi:endonuclease/exonuclease/phosphatase family protein [Glycomyces sp. L485]|uniref:endonuclease/exonuclease/phosphatase family protein n=1 Tax=Glycomyces sp. L485 TaxID=2909235 RepID=UPI001F4ACE23|nr:endonuclease/exonuclease/phosphatase family protein [Glycomyces sp. L485]MCH7229565.1 endonuclease/exonuclease/phosphatase family protein [Glycomyces sp. L485]
MTDAQSNDAILQLDHVDEPQRKAAGTRWYRTRVFRSLSWTATAGVVAYSLIRLLGLETGWILVTTIAFVPYLAAAALVGAGMQAAFRHWRAAIVTAAAALAMVAAIVPRVLPENQPVAEGAELTVMSVNMYVGVANVKYIIELVDRYEPDILSVQELTPSGFDELASRGLEERLPHVIAEPAWNAVGTGIYSRHPMERLEELEPDGIFYQPAAEVTLPDESKIRFMAVHVAAPGSPERIPDWEADFEDFPATGSDVPWVLAGDFNSTLDHRLLRQVVDSGYSDAADATGEGLVPTWRPFEGGFLGNRLHPPAVTLDHVLVDERAAVRDFEVLDRDGSDHAPVVATIRLPS